MKICHRSAAKIWTQYHEAPWEGYPSLLFLFPTISAVGHCSFCNGEAFTLCSQPPGGRTIKLRKCCGGSMQKMLKCHPLIEARKPTQNPEIPKKYCVHANFFEKFARTFAFFPMTEVRKTDGNCSEKLVQMNFFILGGFFSGGFSSSELRWGLLLSKR